MHKIRTLILMLVVVMGTFDIGIGICSTSAYPTGGGGNSDGANSDLEEYEVGELDAPVAEVKPKVEVRTDKDVQTNAVVKTLPDYELDGTSISGTGGVIKTDGGVFNGEDRY